MKKFVIIIILVFAGNNLFALDLDKVYYKRHILKTSPITYLFEPTLFYDHMLMNGKYISLKIGYKIGKDNTQSDQDQGRAILYQYYSGPVLGIGYKIPTKWGWKKAQNKGVDRNWLLDFELIYKKMSVNKVNLATSGFTGELRDYERLGGKTDGFTLKAMIVRQFWYNHLLLECFAGVGLKWRMNDGLYKIGYGMSNGNSGTITYHGYKDYEDYQQHYDPSIYKVTQISDQVFPTIHFGINVGFGW